MTSDFPEDEFIESATMHQLQTEGNLNPQPGLIDPHSDLAGDSGSGSSRTAVVVLSVIGVIILAVVGAAVYYLLALAGGRGTDDSPQAGPGPSGEPTVEQPSAEDLYNKYIAMADDDSIFLIIPRTDEGWAYFSAFVYKLADYKAAESIGGPLDQDSVEEMLALEARFVALQDLEMTVDITRSDGTQFYHDGQPPATTVATPSP